MSGDLYIKTSENAINLSLQVITVILLQFFFHFKSKMKIKMSVFLE